MNEKTQANMRTFAKGDIIINEGAHDTLAYLILEGRVEISKTIKNHKIIITKAGKNELIGEMAFFDSDRRSATVKAIEDTKVLIFTKTLLDLELAKVQPWLSAFVRVLVERARTADYLINPMTTADYYIASLFLLHYLFATSTSKDNQASYIDARHAEEHVSSLLCLESEFFRQFEQLLHKQKILGIQPHAAFEKAYVLQSSQRLSLLAERLKQFNMPPEGEAPLTMVTEARKLLDFEAKLPELTTALIKQPAGTTVKIPWEDVAKSAPALLSLLNTPLKYAAPAMLKVDYENKVPATLLITPALLPYWTNTLREERLVLDFLEKFYATGIAI